MDRAYAEYVLPDDELNRLRNGAAKSPRKPNGSPPRKAGSARPGSGSLRSGESGSLRSGGSQRQGQEAIPPRPQTAASPRSRAIAQAFERKPGLRPYSAGANPKRSSTETYVISASRGSSRAATPTVTSPPWPKSPASAPAEVQGHPASMPRRHSPPGRISEGLEAQLDMTARALSAARNQVDEERRKANIARKAEETQRLYSNPTPTPNSNLNPAPAPTPTPILNLSLPSTYPQPYP